MENSGTAIGLKMQVVRSGPCFSHRTFHMSKPAVMLILQEALLEKFQSETYWFYTVLSRYIWLSSNRNHEPESIQTTVGVCHATNPQGFKNQRTFSSSRCMTFGLQTAGKSFVKFIQHAWRRWRTVKTTYNLWNKNFNSFVLGNY